MAESTSVGDDPELNLFEPFRFSVPLPLGCEVCEAKSNKGRSRHRQSFMHRVYSAPRGIETMVSDNGLGRGQTMG